MDIRPAGDRNFAALYFHEQKDGKLPRVTLALWPRAQAALGIGQGDRAHFGVSLSNRSQLMIVRSTLHGPLTWRGYPRAYQLRLTASTHLFSEVPLHLDPRHFVLDGDAIIIDLPKFKTTK